ncbi:MAG: pantoate--beta-alanine ligase [Candidatus Eisenbacteria bacterium]|uniref:Pantothenate synthetase n=1 Tax=Eiseniibacteriota bacterium TaxID=2212470 RepID=A0A948RVA4_UNCEI|nr:pantoate--beta-alanine ligase [Candidatus Eisenbacteria bacterium]MBU1951279.1 pantoate--beta-alanine ligase [Candidatus Eisenbacteria bacterium]MBU2689622.1 pantoate--beta-alanine ligase [Candidatus Eisenbacteria bacterium]
MPASKKTRRFQAPQSMKKYCRNLQKQGRSIGFVPTMGYFHDGHIAIIRKARQQNDEIVVSIFVNPMQFGPHEDCDRYPRDLPRDMDICRDEGVGAVFIPETKDLYPDGFSTKVSVGRLGELLCGKSRPGHFDGVATVVLKLLEIVRPDRFYLGQKDAQQALIITRMVDDFNLDSKLTIVPTVREKDGLALSSRNAYLSEEERRQAPVLSRALRAVQKKMLVGGETGVEAIETLMKEMIESEPLARLDYARAVDHESLEGMDPLRGRILLAVAAYFGEARLIDNLPVTVPGRMATERHRQGGA